MTLQQVFLIKYISKFVVSYQQHLVLLDSKTDLISKAPTSEVVTFHGKDSSV